MGERTTSKTGESDHHFAPPTVPKNTDYRHARWSQSRTEDQVETTSTTLSPQPLVPRPHIVVVGVCSSGKSSLVGALQERGYDARACAQEHSGVPHLWQRSEPDVLVYLDALVHTIRRRRRAKWPQRVLDEEHSRLSHAREHCDLYIPTDGLSPDDVVARVVTFLNNHRARSEQAKAGS